MATDPLGDLAPMKAVSGTLPDDDGGWAYEVKWDGMRVLTGVDGTLTGRRGGAGGAAIRAVSGNGLDVGVRFPELDGLADHLAGHRAVLDGEVVAFDDEGRTDFGRLQPRMHASSAAKVAALRGEVAVTYVIFDLLRLDGVDTFALPYLDRRELLTDLVETAGDWSVPAHQLGDGEALFAAATAHGLEGIMAKRVDSTYLPGKRSSAWRKVKVRRRQEVVVGGWSTGTGTRSTTLGALLVGVRDPGDEGGPLRFAGGVGTGFTDATLRDLLARLGPLATDECPFDPRPPTAVSRTAHWVRPELVAEVEFAHWTGDGRLRHPAYQGLRIDKDPSQVVREPGP
jgi:bifunctional non-homologous end joining protein LigD